MQQITTYLNAKEAGMKILLVGEYSRLHNSLKEGLLKLGHQVVLIGLEDGFKKYPTDLLIRKKYDSGFLKKIKIFLYLIFRIDISSLSIERQVRKHQKELTGHDVVQFINENALSCSPKVAKRIFDFFRKENKKTFLLSCGTDHLSVKYAFEKKLRYSLLTPYFNGKSSKSENRFVLSYLDRAHESLHHWIFKHIEGVIASDLDYHLPLKNHPKYKGCVPNCINTSLFETTPLKTAGKIRIFHGINKENYYRKGNDFFEKALAIVEKKHPERIEVLTVSNLPYDVYIKSYKSAHILLDQVYSYDQGYNALEAMAQGKVVFTGAEQEWLDQYGLEEDSVAINALPNTEKIVEKLEKLLLHPEKIEAISKNAVAFVKREHDHVLCAKKYTALWNQ